MSVMSSVRTPLPKATATAEMLLVSPITPSSPPPPGPSLPRKRKFTPSSEASSVKGIAVITMPVTTTVVENSTVQRSSFPNPLGWPACAAQAHVDARQTLLPNPLFQGDVVAQPLQPLLPLRHISLLFDLRDDPDAFYEAENREVLESIFPGTYGLAMDGMFLYFLQTKMPPKPWPKTVAGLPPYFAPEVSRQHTPSPTGTPVSRRNGSIADDQNGLDMKDWEPLFQAVKNHFRDQGISITEVMYLNSYVVIVLEHRDVDFTKLPYKAANITCMYVFDDEIGRPAATLPARCLTDLTPGNPDESEYSTLQPGLRLTSTYLPSKPGMFLSTTAGVLVRDKIGNEFMTAASHGFPDECERIINHPLPPGGRNIGELIMEITHTDIALVKLRDTETFSNVTFQNDILPDSIQLKRLTSAKNLKIGDSVFLDSPDTGCLAGNFLMTSFQRVASTTEQQPQEEQWVFTIWDYMGQDSADTLPEGMAGSAIWNEDGDVLGFTRYAPKTGIMKDWCAGVASDELINRDFTLVNTTN
ncbi:hypothetical protein FQN52_003207 [Onygenales sp. PD_12]|nr:hypothetical protein FQN52_003207 [Onygenales sp. PD_12]